ncbi:hypothetical protein E5288_WYG021967 [Bos mutus]|uniref:C2H2-type domain-containing protein n=1 Tax=Bos mutus TaxID=72004 RepID=A0A6B0SL13_9CETA|nr:hypothetical protein [Bos mutus]
MFLDKQVIDKPLHKRGDKSWDERGSLHPTVKRGLQGREWGLNSRGPDMELREEAWSPGPLDSEDQQMASHENPVDILIMDDDDVPSWPPTKLGLKPFVCPRCGRGFSQPKSLARHLRLHPELSGPGVAAKVLAASVRRAKAPEEAAAADGEIAIPVGDGEGIIVVGQTLHRELKSQDVKGTRRRQRQTPTTELKWILRSHHQ